MRVAADDELIHFSARRPTDQRVVLKHIDRLNYFADPRVAIADVVFGKMIQYAVKIVPKPGRQLNFCHNRV